ncbi:MAG: ring-hydroxylating dioxygenase subunit beta [Betaproteobacteria bacterium]|nr:ring-hydroxylating dioxygenase subunit beta [Betaproteobacteria bacterium]
MSNVRGLDKAAANAASVSTALDRATIETFLYREARLADENRYDEWIALWTDDAIYWVPANLDDYDPHHHLSIIYDDRDRLQDRMDRLNSGAAWAQEPRSRMRRVVSNIEVESPAANGDITVRSNFVLGELRRGRQTSYYAGQVHRLRPSPEGLKMAYKKVMLINNNEPIHNLTFIL